MNMTLNGAETAAILQALAELELNGPNGEHNYLLQEDGRSGITDTWLLQLMAKVSAIAERAAN